MHDILEFLKYVLGFVVPSLPFLKSMLDTTKAATETVTSVQKLLPIIKRGPDEVKPDDEADITPDQAAERVYAASHLLRTYALFGFLESVTWIAKMTFSYLLIAKWIDYMRHKYSTGE